jgi:hypothetical protein
VEGKRREGRKEIGGKGRGGRAEKGKGGEGREGKEGRAGKGRSQPPHQQILDPPLVRSLISLRAPNLVNMANCTLITMGYNHINRV